jgi:uncharacterized protein YecT (DUF1311 family)
MCWGGREFFLTFLILATGSVARGQCEEAKSTLQINECYARELKRVDAELNKVYHLTLKKLQVDDAALLRKSQRAWLVYRDVHYEAERALWGGGTGGPAAWMSCKLELTSQRTAEIKNVYQNQ